MNRLGVTLALAAAIAAGASSAGEAQAQERRGGAHSQRHAAAHPQRGATRTPAYRSERHRAAPWAGQRAGHRGHLHPRAHAPGRFAHFKRHHYGHRPGHRPGHGPGHGPGHWHAKRMWHPHRLHGPRRIYVVPEYAPAYNRALEIETPEFRFRVNASG